MMIVSTFASLLLLLGLTTSRPTGSSLSCNANDNWRVCDLDGRMRVCNAGVITFQNCQGGCTPDCPVGSPCTPICHAPARGNNDIVLVPTGAALVTGVHVSTFYASSMPTTAASSTQATNSPAPTFSARPLTSSPTAYATQYPPLGKSLIHISEPTRL